MAVYEFECQSCGKRFEISVAITEHDRLKNRPPACRSVVSAKPSSSLRLSAARPLASTERFALSETATLTWGGGRPPRPGRCPLPPALFNASGRPAASLGLGVLLWGSSPCDFTTRALHRRGRVRVGYVLAVPDSPAVRLLDHRRVVEAPRLLNVRRLQVVSHNHVLLSAP